MRADDDGAARLQRNQHLVDRRGGRVGRRHDRRHDAERLGDLDHLLLVETVHHAHRAHRSDELVNALRGEQIFLDLVGHHPEAGLLDGQARQGFRVGRHGLGHGRHDGVDLFLTEFGQRGLGLPGGSGQGTRLRDRGEIGIRCGGRRSWLGHV